MLKKIKLASILFVLLITPVCFAETAAKDTDNALVFEVIQDEFVLDHSTVKTATLHQDAKGKFDGIMITLKDAAATDFSHMSKDAIGKQANFVFNNKIVSSSMIQTALPNSFVLTGIAKEDADAFMQKLQLAKPNVVAEKATQNQ